jgi:hypothetical protein
VSLDLEWEGWRREWSADTEPLPALQRKVRAQNRRFGLGIAAIALCLAAGAVLALTHPSDSGWSGFAAGLWITCLVAGGYVWWIRRGTWEPSAETTQAYVELLHRRAIAEGRKLAFLRGCVWVALAGYGAFLLWRGRGVSVPAGLVIAGLLLEALWIHTLARRRRHAVDEAAALMERLSEHSYSEREELE